MTSHRHALPLRALALLLCAAPAAAQRGEGGSAAGVAEPGFDLLWEVAERFEHRDPFDMATGQGGGDARSLTRVGAGFRWGWGNRADVHVMGHAAAVDFDDVEGELIHAYADLHALWSYNYDLRVGRFPVQWGDGRFLGENRWELTPSAWEGVRVVGGERLDWELLVVDGATGPADLHDQRLYGARVQWRAADRTFLDLGFVQLDQDDLLRTELDLYIKLEHETLHGQRYDLWVVLQDGEDTGFRSLWSQAAALRFTQELDFESTFWLEAAIATGDDDPLDRDSKTYTPSLSNFHEYNGRADVVAFSNLVDFSTGWRKQLSERWAFHSEAHWFLRQNNDDVLYLGVDSTPVATPGTSSDVGQEIDFALETAWTPTLSTEFGVAWFFTGDAFVHDEDFLTAYLWLVWEG